MVTVQTKTVCEFCRTEQLGEAELLPDGKLNPINPDAGRWKILCILMPHGGYRWAAWCDRVKCREACEVAWKRELELRGK